MTGFDGDPVQTVVRFYRALDDRENGVMAGLMAEDGVWERQGAQLRSRAEIDAAMAKRSATMRIHHLLTNLYAETEGDAARVTGYMLVIRHDSGGAPAGPSPLEGMESARTIRVRLRRGGAGWRIVHMQGDAPSFAKVA